MTMHMTDLTKRLRLQHRGRWLRCTTRIAQPSAHKPRHLSRCQSSSSRSQEATTSGRTDAEAAGALACYWAQSVDRACTSAVLSKLRDRVEACQRHRNAGRRQDVVGGGWWLARQTIAMSAAGAALGPFLDGMHSSNNVLHYHDPFVVSVGSWQLESCWWVFVLFGIAGAIIGVGVPWLDTLFNRSSQTSPPTNHTTDSPTAAPDVMAPSWPAVLACIALFVTQYGLSGVLEKPLLGTPGALDVLLIGYAIVHFWMFDWTKAGLVLSVATMVGGPAIEVFLIKVLHLYDYEHPQLWGAIPTWIAWVYFCGGPAVGNLGRRVSADLCAQWQRLE